MILKVIDDLDVTDPSVHMGKHSAWIPDKSIKVPFQWGGRVQKYQHTTEATYDLSVIEEEYSLLKYLSSKQMAPPMYGWVYYKNVVSEHIGAWWCDPLGAYGYQIETASGLPPGKFNFSELKKDPLIEGSEGAWNDLVVKDRKNVVNGYVIDVSRSRFDMLRYKGPIHKIPIYKEDEDSLVDDINKLGQYPFKERSEPYQKINIGGKELKGARDVIKRAKIMRFNPNADDGVVDIGCQLGAFLHYTSTIQAVSSVVHPDDHGRLAGIDIQEEYIDLARRIARYHKNNICFRQANVDTDDIVNWIKQLYPDGVSHLIMLSMVKHIKEKTFWDLVDRIGAKNTYLESNAVKKEDEPSSLDIGVTDRGGKLVGLSDDRNIRKVYKIEKA